MTPVPDAIARLHATLPRRDTPEAVASMIRGALPWYRAPRLALLLQVRGLASVTRLFGHSSMPTTFRQPTRSDAQIARARELAALFLDRALPAGAGPEDAEQVIAELNALIGKRPGAGGFLRDRRNRAERAAIGLELSRRRYDRLFRLAARLERRAARQREDRALHRLLLINRSALATELSVEDFGGHLPTAAFVAYLAARMKLRSEFTVAGQQRPFDDLAAALLRRCERDAETRWWAIAHVFPRADVLARLDDARRGRLLGQWFGVLSETAERLDAAHRRTAIDLDRMIVRRGDDSSTWNLLAGAWNRARDHWIALVEATGQGALLDLMLPGKAMRLMAGDVAAWHRREGGGVHPDTAVWADLPRPWEVLRLERPCGRAAVEAACARHGVDPVASGWSAPRPRTAVAPFRPTPELVHGVSVASPALAAFLRRAGAFSGKPPRRFPPGGPGGTDPDNG